MYAVVEVGGKQYRVEQGQSLLVDRMPESVGTKVSLKPLLFRPDNGEAVFEGAQLGKVKVGAKVTEHLRGEKIRVFKFKPKRGYRRQTGHRSELTRIEIEDIKAGVAAKAASTTSKSAGAKSGAASKAAKPDSKSLKKAASSKEEG